MKLKKIIGVIGVYYLGFNNAHAWETLVSCDQGRVKIEHECYNAPSEYGGGNCYSSKTQMVIRNQDIQNYFASKHAYGMYEHEGRFYGFQSEHYPEMLIPIDVKANWGYAGHFDYILNIPYSYSETKVSYYVNILDAHSIRVKATTKSGSVYGIIGAGDIASVEFHDCWIK